MFNRNVNRFKNNRPEYSDRKKGRTSRLDANGVPEANPSQDARTGYINVRLDGARSAVEVVIGPLMRPNWELVPDLPVDTGVDRSGRRVCIKPSDPNDQQIGVYGNDLSSSALETRVFASRNFAPGQVTAWVAGGYPLSVFVQPLPYGSIVISGSLDVSAAVPATPGEKLLVVVYWDVSDGALGYVAGTATGLLADFTLNDVVALDLGDTDRIRLGAVVLENGQTTIDGSTLFIDARDWLTPSEGTASGEWIVDYVTTIPAEVTSGLVTRGIRITDTGSLSINGTIFVA